MLARSSHLVWFMRSQGFVFSPPLPFPSNGVLYLTSLTPIREEYIEKVRGATKKSRNPYLSVIWTEGGAQPALEEVTGLTFGFPAVVAISIEKKVSRFV